MAEATGSFGERESAVLAFANEVLRRWTQRELQRIADHFEDEILVDGQRHRRHASGTRKYHSLCGPVEIRRDTYRRVGIHNGPTVVPLDLAAGILENATPALAASVVQAFAMMPLRHYEDEMKVAHRCVPSRSTLERIGKRIGAAVHEELPVIEPVLRSREMIPEHAGSISIGLDRTTIPMAESLADARKPKTASHVRRRPPPTTVAYRMAYVATLAVNDSDGETIASTRITATAEEGPIEMMERLGEELRHLLSQRPSLPVVVIQDGAPELWNLTREWLANFGVRPAMNLVDRYHVEQRLAQTADAIEPNQFAARCLLEKWRRDLDRSDTAIHRIRREIGARLFAPATRRPAPATAGAELAWPLDMPYPKSRPEPFERHVRLLKGERAQAAEENYDYFERHAARLHYASARRRGFPIGSGVTEGACKSVIATRFKRSGQRWCERGVSPCLHLRTMHLNERLSGGLRFLVERRRKSLLHA
jgi:hypothetical protein